MGSVVEEPLTSTGKPKDQFAQNAHESKIDLHGQPPVHQQRELCFLFQLAALLHESIATQAQESARSKALFKAFARPAL